jgi:hypothetical protein
MRRYGIHDAHLGASAPIKCSHLSTGGTAPPLQSRQVQISSKLRRGKDIGPTCRFAASLEVGPRATVSTLQTGYPCAQDLSQVPRRQTPHSTWEGCGITTCPVAPAPHPSEGGLRCHHMSCGSRPASWCGRALASLCVPWHWACLPAGEGSGVTTCPAVLKLPPGVGGLWSHHVSRGTRLALRQGRDLVSPRVPRSRPASWCGRTLVLPHVLWHRAHPQQGRAQVSHGSRCAMGHKQKGNT